MAMTVLRDAVAGFSDLFFPTICYGCGNNVLAKNQLLCLRCLSSLPLTNFHLIDGNPVEKIFWGRMQVQRAASLLFFSKNSVVQSLLHELKYRGKKDVGYYCGRLMGDALKQSSLYSGVDIIVPLPLFKSKKRKRGYNQSELLAIGISEVINKPVVATAVERVVQTETQTKKNRVERWQNMNQGFLVTDAYSLNGKHILLVDDVVTTGATLEACGSALLSVPGSALSLFTFAYSSGKNF